VQVEGDVLAVLETEGRGDRVAGGGQGAHSVDAGDDLGGGHVPDVGEDQDLRCGVQLQEGAGAGGELGVGVGPCEIGHGPNLGDDGAPWAT
jgi:hypothetical protein